MKRIFFLLFLFISGCSEYSSCQFGVKYLGNEKGFVYSQKLSLYFCETPSGRLLYDWLPCKEARYPVEIDFCKEKPL